jgi:hypothetical protein
MKFSAPTLNLTWPRSAVIICNSGTNITETWPGAQYKSYRIFFLLFKGYSGATIGLTIQELWSLKAVGGCWKFWFEPNDVICQLWNLSLMEARSVVTLNIGVVGNSISFLKRVETQNFDTRWRNHEGLKLIGFSRYDFELESNFKFFFVFKVRFLMQYECMMSWQKVVLSILTKRIGSPNIDNVCIVGSDLHSTPWLYLVKWLTRVWLAYLQKSTIDIYIYIHHHLSPKWHPCV